VVSSFTVQLPAQSEMADLQIYSVLGKQLLHKTLSQEEETVDVSTIASGVYIIKISIGKKSNTFKFIKS